MGIVSNNNIVTIIGFVYWRYFFHEFIFKMVVDYRF